MSPLRTLYTRISQGSVLLPIAFGCIYYKKLDTAFRIFFYYLIASGIGEVISTLMGRRYDNNRPVMHALVLLQILVFSIIFIIHFRKNKTVKTLIAINMCIGIVIAFMDSFVTNDIWELATLSGAYTAISITVYVLVYFYYIFKTDLIQYIWGNPMFWLCIGCLIYFAVNVLYFMLMGYLVKTYGHKEILGWGSHNMLLIFANCLFAQAFRCFRKPTTLP